MKNVEKTYERGGTTFVGTFTGFKVLGQVCSSRTISDNLMPFQHFHLAEIGGEDLCKGRP